MKKHTLSLSLAGLFLFATVCQAKSATNLVEADSETSLIHADRYQHAKTAYRNWTSADIPLDNWIYPALDKLQGLGLIVSGLPGTRPYTRMEAARQTLGAQRNVGKQNVPPVTEDLIRKLTVELHQQIVEAGALVGIPAGSYIKPLGDWEFKYLNRDGEDLTYPENNAGNTNSRIDARQDSLNYNNFGIDYGQDHNAQAVFEIEARLGERLLLNLRPLLLFQEDSQGEEDETTVDLLQGKLALGLGPFEVSIGRQSLWWGQGRHGSLVLTNNAKPLDMIRLTNPHPVLLPWFFDVLGPFRFDVFLSQLEQDRIVPEPYFGGMRIEFKPLPWLNLGASRTLMFGGDGRPKVGLSDFLTIISGKNLSGKDKDTSNSVAALDMRLKFPFLWNTEIYGELGGEDEAGGFISNKAYLFGVFLPQIEPTGRASLRVEYADLSHIDDNSGVWYRHGIYRSGYTYENKILGHHAGGGSEDLFAELEIFFPRDLTLKIGYDYERRGADQPVEELHHQSTLELRWDFHENMFLAFDWRHDAVENFDYMSGQDEDFYLTELAVGGRF